MDFNFVTENIAVGTTPETETDVQVLLNEGVTHVINCRDDVDDAALFAGRFRYLWNGTPDWNPSAPFGGEPKPVEWFRKSIEFWYGPRNNPKNRLLVHCSAGVNRSATTAWMLLRSLQIDGADCDIIIDTHRPLATWGTIADHPWRDNGEYALRMLGYIRATQNVVITH